MNRRRTPEERARANGYTGAFPPRREVARDPGDVRSKLVTLCDGDHRPNLIKAASDGLSAFASALEPSTFVTFAGVLKSAAFSSCNNARVRLAAIESMLRPAQLLADEIRKLDSAPRVSDDLREFAQHLGKCLEAFRDTIKPADYGNLAGVLEKLSEHTDARIRVRAGRALLKISKEAAASANKITGPARDTVLTDEDQRIIDAARVEVRQMDKEIRRARRISDDVT